MFEMCYEGKPTGIFVEEWPKNLSKAEKWSAGWVTNMRYSTGCKNAVHFPLGGADAFVFRAKNLGIAATANMDTSLVKHDVPLCGVMTNPGSSHVMLSDKYFMLEGVKRYAFYAFHACRRL